LDAIWALLRVSLALSSVLRALLRKKCSRLHFAVICIFADEKKKNIGCILGSFAKEPFFAGVSLALSSVLRALLRKKCSRKIFFWEIRPERALHTRERALCTRGYVKLCRYFEAKESKIEHSFAAKD